MWGGLLATSIFVRDLIRSRRRIVIILEHVAYYGTVNLNIVNIGQRPITITDLSISTCGGRAPRANAFAPDSSAALPCTLSDGQHLAMKLSEPLSQALLECGLRAELAVYDAEGRAYRRFTRRIHNARFGGSDSADQSRGPRLLFGTARRAFQGIRRRFARRKTK